MGFSMCSELRRMLEYHATKGDGHKKKGLKRIEIRNDILSQ